MLKSRFRSEEQASLKKDSKVKDKTQTTGKIPFPKQNTNKKNSCWEAGSYQVKSDRKMLKQHTSPKNGAADDGAGCSPAGPGPWTEQGRATLWKKSVRLQDKMQCPTHRVAQDTQPLAISLLCRPLAISLSVRNPSRFLSLNTPPFFSEVLYTSENLAIAALVFKGFC